MWSIDWSFESKKSITERFNTVNFYYINLKAPPTQCPLKTRKDASFIIILYIYTNTQIVCEGKFRSLHDLLTFWRRKSRNHRTKQNINYQNSIATVPKKQLIDHSVHVQHPIGQNGRKRKRVILKLNVWNVVLLSMHSEPLGGAIQEVFTKACSWYKN